MGEVLDCGGGHLPGCGDDRCRTGRRDSGTGDARGSACTDAADSDAHSDSDTHTYPDADTCGRARDVHIAQASGDEEWSDMQLSRCFPEERVEKGRLRPGE